MRVGACLVLGAAVVGLAACGGGGSGGGQSCTPGQTFTLTINDTGFPNGNNACVQLGGQVTFANTGSNAHNIVFDTPGCPTTVSVPANPGSAIVTFPQTAVNCNFHIDTNTTLSGTVAVTDTTVSGGGY